MGKPTILPPKDIKPPESKPICEILFFFSALRFLTSSLGNDSCFWSREGAARAPKASNKGELHPLGVPKPIQPSGAQPHISAPKSCTPRPKGLQGGKQHAAPQVPDPRSPSAVGWHRDEAGGWEQCEHAEDATSAAPAAPQQHPSAPEGGDSSI